MKRIFLICCLSTALGVYAQEITIVESSPDDETTLQKTAEEFSITNTMLFAALYGGLSGYLSRVVERQILGDILPLRLCNMMLWGSIERSIIKDYIIDLEQRNIVHSPTALLNLTRIVSWISYLLA